MTTVRQRIHDEFVRARRRQREHEFQLLLDELATCSPTSRTDLVAQRAHQQSTRTPNAA